MTLPLGLILYALSVVVAMVVTRLLGMKGDAAFLVGFFWPAVCIWFMPDLVGTALDHIKPIREGREMTDIHSCSYYCDWPECVKAQRDELRDRNV